MLLLKLFGRVVNYVLTLGIIGFGWYQDPKLVEAAFQWNASLLPGPNARNQARADTLRRVRRRPSSKARANNRAARARAPCPTSRSPARDRSLARLAVALR